MDKEKAFKTAGAAGSLIGRGAKFTAKAGYNAVKNHKSGSSQKDSEEEDYAPSAPRPLESLTDPRTFQAPPKRNVGMHPGPIRQPSYSNQSAPASSQIPAQPTVQTSGQFQQQLQPQVPPQQLPGNQNYQNPSQPIPNHGGPPPLPGRQLSQNPIGDSSPLPGYSQTGSNVSNGITRAGQDAGSQFMQSQLQNSGYAEAQNPQIKKAGAAFGSFIGGQLAQQGQQQAKEQLQQQLQGFQNPQQIQQGSPSQDGVQAPQSQLQMPQNPNPEQYPQTQQPNQFQQPNPVKQPTEFQQPYQIQQPSSDQQPSSAQPRQFQQPASVQQPNQYQQSNQYQQLNPAQQSTEFQQTPSAQRPALALPNQFQQPAPTQQPALAQPNQFQQPNPTQQPDQFQQPNPTQQPNQFQQSILAQEASQFQRAAQVSSAPQVQQPSPDNQSLQGQLYSQEATVQDRQSLPPQQNVQPQMLFGHQSQETVPGNDYQPALNQISPAPLSPVTQPSIASGMVPQPPQRVITEYSPLQSSPAEPQGYQNPSIISSPPQNFAPPPLHVARGSSPSTHNQGPLSPTTSQNTATTGETVQSSRPVPLPPPRNTFSLPDISTVGPPPPKPFRSVQEREKLEQEKRHQEEFNRMRMAHRTTSMTPSYPKKPNSPSEAVDTGSPAPPETDSSKDSVAYPPPPPTFRSASSTAGDVSPVAPPKPTVKSGLRNITSPSPPPAPSRKLSSKGGENLSNESHKKPPPKPSKPKSLVNIKRKEEELETNKVPTPSEPTADLKTASTVQPQEDLVSEMERVMINRRKKIQEKETATNAPTKPSRPAKPAVFDKSLSSDQRPHHSPNTRILDAKNSLEMEEHAPVKPTRPPKPALPKPHKPTPPVSKPKPYLRSKIPTPKVNQQLNLQLETGWYKNLDQIPPEAVGLIYKTSMRQTGSEYTRHVSFRMKDLGTVQAEIKWCDNSAPVATQKYTAPPTATHDQLVEGRNMFNEHVATWAESHEGKCVGDGECWTLAKLALEKGCGKHAFVSQYFHHGALLFTKDASGVTEANPTDSIARGDILQFYECTITDHNSTTKLGAPHHTAIVLSCNSDGSLNIIHQNVNGVKKVMRQKLSLNVVGGSMNVYRPVTKAWIEEL